MCFKHFTGSSITLTEAKHCESSRHALATRPIAKDRNSFAIGRPIGWAHIALKDALADCMFIFRKLLDRAVVDHKVGIAS